MSYAFVSYSRKDSIQVGNIINRLRQAGYVLWQDIDGIPLGSEWKAQLESAIEGAGAMLVMWSQASASSPYVKAEIATALTQTKVIIPINLDGTEFDATIGDFQGVKLHSRYETGLKELQEKLSKVIQPRQKLPFKPYEPIKVQKSSDEPYKVDTTLLYRVPLIASGFCRADVVGTSDTVPEQIDIVQLCIQVSRNVQEPFIADVYRAVASITPNFVPENFIAIHVMGPVRNGEYRLDNDNKAEWVDVVDTAYEAVLKLSSSGRPSLRVFNLGTVPLGTALGAKFFKFWHLQLFHFVSGKYKHILDILPEGT